MNAMEQDGKLSKNSLLSLAIIAKTMEPSDLLKYGSTFSKALLSLPPTHRTSFILEKLPLFLEEKNLENKETELESICKILTNLEDHVELEMFLKCSTLLLKKQLSSEALKELSIKTKIISELDLEITEEICCFFNSYLKLA